MSLSGEREDLLTREIEDLKSKLDKVIERKSMYPAWDVNI